jgi:hypothetical protein
MTAHGPEKRSLQKKIAEAKEKIAKWAGTVGDADAFDWTVEFAEIFIGPGEGAATLTGGMTGVVNATAGQMQLAAQEGRASGFDIIVANPPYVRQELQTQAQKERFKTLYPEVYRGTADLYVYFYTRALQLLREGGVASFISSNKWLRAGYGKKLRRHLKATATVESIIDFGDLPLFGAIAYPQIITFRNQPSGSEHTVQALEIEDLAVVDHLSDVVQAKAWPQPQSSLRADVWALVTPIVLNLIQKLRDHSSLERYLDSDLYMGIKTGYNAAFVIDQDTYETFIEKSPQSEEILKPWIRGRNIKRWRVDWEGEYVIAIQNSGDEDANNPWAKVETEQEAEGIFRNTYPLIHEHLSQYESRLRKRWDQGEYWWELRTCTYYSQFEKPKIVYPDIAKSPKFAYDTDGYYGVNTLYTIPTDDLYVLGLLNSKAVEFFYSHTSTTIREDYLRFIPLYMKRVPIPTPTEAQRDAIETLVRQLLDVEGEGPQAREWERALNALVYAVYDLTPAEIALIEEATAGGA